ncbi:MAG: NAD-binding protein, partial [Cyanobacteria bacterium P01_D01_bin.1]
MDNQPDHFIVCGLGSLGQQTVVNLNKFSQAPDDISIAAIDLSIPTYWEIENLLDLLSAPLIIGDSRRYDLLRQAGIERCRSILIVTSDESINVETALVARRLNPAVHLVLRSSRPNLNQLLKRQLGRFVALDAMELAASTFALSGISDNVLSLFKIGDISFRVVQKSVTTGSLRYDGKPLQHLHRRDDRLLDFVQRNSTPPTSTSKTPSKLFHRWQPHTKTSPGDVITMIEIDHASQRKGAAAPKRLSSRRLSKKAKRWLKALVNGDWRHQFSGLWAHGEQRSLQRVMAIALSTVLVSWPIGTLLIKQAVPTLSWGKAVTLGVILLLGGYGDVFGGLEEYDLPVWLPLVCLLIALASLFLVLSGFSVLTERLLSSRFEFLRRRPQLPEADHIIVVGVGRLGYRAISILQEFNQSLIAITQELSYPELMNQVPILVGNILQQLKQANLATAKSVIAATDDPMLNLEIALIVSEAHPSPFTPIIRAANQGLSENVAVLLPQAKAFSVYALSAEAFAGAAFGENIVGLFRLQGQTILIAEYNIEAGDQLSGKLLAEIAYGYGVVPILLQTTNSQGERQAIPIPSDDLRSRDGDRLYVLSSINGLRRIERGEVAPPSRWRLQVGKPLNQQVLLSAGNILVQLSGLDLSWCRDLMSRLPTSVELQLYDHQA